MTGSFGSPNDLAAFLTIALPLAFERAAANRRLKRLAWAAVFLLMLAAFVWTLSRAAFLAMFGVTLVYLARRAKWRTVAVLAVSPALFFLSPVLRANFFGSLTLTDITIGGTL